MRRQPGRRLRLGARAWVVVIGAAFVLGACGAEPDSQVQRDQDVAQVTTASMPAQTRTANTPAQTASRRPYRIVGEPVALIEATSDGPMFQVRARFNRKLPADSEGAFAAVLLGEAGLDTPLSPFGRRSRRCYVGVIGNDFDAPGLCGVMAGSRVLLTIRVPSRGPIVTRRTVTLLRAQSQASTNAIASLHCGRLRA